MQGVAVHEGDLVTVSGALPGEVWRVVQVRHGQAVVAPASLRLAGRIGRRLVATDRLVLHLEPED